MSLLDLKGTKILIVDDFDEMRNLVKSMIDPLRPDKIVTCRNGAEAIEQMEKTSFDIVFCDYNLGKGKDGQQILEEARHRSLLPYSAIFFMITAESTSEMVMAAIDYLPDDYLSKPFTKSLLLRRLEKLCGRKSELSDIAHAYENKDYAKALALCNQKLNSQPKGQTELLKTKGELMCRLGQQEEAQHFFEDLLEQRDFPWAKQALGDIYFTRKLYFEAEEVYESLIKENPANMIAHDALARTYEMLGDLHRCQNTLVVALEKSPKSLLRQRKLAEIALRNEDFATAEAAFQRAIHEGKYSCYKNPSDFSGFAKTLLNHGQLDRALEIIEQMKKEFKQSAEALFHSAATTALIHMQKEDNAACEQSLEEVLSLFDRTPDELDFETALDITSTAMSIAMADKIEKIVRYLVSNNLNNDLLLDRILQVYRDHDLEEKGSKIIKETKQEIIKINNEGAMLLKDGKLEESIEFFMKAAKAMPNNTTININVAYSMILQMEETEKVTKYYTRAIRYLERVLELDPNNQKYHQLMKKIQTISSKAA